uniref:Uncharacterized protein n=1 Tax=Anopheles quadriannulatus TaxID=34691 RepID=A0A182X5R2_ANOQN
RGRGQGLSDAEGAEGHKNN